MINKVTIKQEAFCQAYIKLGDKSAAYREAYAWEKMKPTSVNRKAFEVFENVNVRARIEVLRSELKKRNNLTIDDIVSTLGDMLRFDIAELYDSNGVLKNIHSIPKKARMMIAQLDSDQIKFKGQSIGTTKKVKILDKLSVVEKLMKHLGGFEQDNKQKALVLPDGFSAEKQARLDELAAKYLLLQDK